MNSVVVPIALLALAMVSARLIAAPVGWAWARALASSQPQLARWSPLVLAIPPVVGLSIALAVLVPMNPLAWLEGACHCDPAVTSWFHLCPFHPPPAWPLAPLTLAVLLAAGLAPVKRWLDLAKGCWTAHAILRGATCSHGAPQLARLGGPNAVTAGLLRPQVVVDARWWQGLEAAERAVVLSHEQAHAARRDPLTLAVILALGALLPASAATRIIQAWEDHAELVADRHAARELGHPALVAQILLRLHKRSALIPGFVTAWTGGRLDQRVHALLADDGGAQPLDPDLDGVVLLGLAAVSAMVLGWGPWLHGLVELGLNKLF